MKKTRKKEEFLEQLRKIPIVQVCCEKVGVSRNSVYRWRKEDDDFNKAMAEALAEGEAFITDMSESQLISLIKDKHFPAVHLWLRQHHPKYKDKVEITGRFIHERREQTAEDKELIKEALRLAMPKIKETKEHG